MLRITGEINGCYHRERCRAGAFRQARKLTEIWDGQGNLVGFFSPLTDEDSYKEVAARVDPAEFQVVYSPLLQEELALVSLEASDPDAVTSAANAIDAILTLRPAQGKKTEWLILVAAGSPERGLHVFR